MIRFLLFAAFAGSLPAQTRLPTQAIQRGNGRLTPPGAPFRSATVSGVGNGADFSSSVAPGSLASVFGSGFAETAASPSALPFPTSFNGVSISVNGRPAPITYLSPTQINFQIPVATPAGNATLTVTSGGVISNSLFFPVVPTALGIFQYGTNRGIVQNQDYSLNTTAVPAATSSAVIVYLTGIGVTAPAVVDGMGSPAVPLAKPSGTATATIGGANAQVLFLGLTPGNVGLAQANLLIPPSLSTGDYPFTITLNGQTSRPARIAVQGTSTPPTGGGTGIGGLPTGGTCVSGKVDYIGFSLEKRASRQADEVSIGGTKLCATCQLKPPIYGNFSDKLEGARVEGLTADACYDSFGTMNYVRLRP